MSENTAYEQPLNERVRTLLRLEALFGAIHTTLQESTQVASHAALGQLTELLALTERGDLKKDLLKELERHAHTLPTLQQRSEVDPQRLGQLLVEIDDVRGRLDREEGRLGQEIRQMEFFKGFHRRCNLPGSLSAVDFPLYSYWLSRTPKLRERDLREWLQHFDTIRDAALLVLRMIRQSARASEEIAEAGFYQQSLDKDVPYQMIRATLPREAPCYAEMSVGRHRFSVRFMIPSLAARPVQTHDDVPFRLTCCLL